MKPSPLGIRLLIATDAWEPQLNGVVKTMQRTIGMMRERGAEIALIEPGQFPRFPLPGYAEIPIALPRPSRIARVFADLRPTHLHIVTEGPIGWMTRRHALRNGLAFSTAYHTRFPEYLRQRMPVPLSWSYAFMRAFHNAGNATLVTTPSMERELTSRGFLNLRAWSRGVDLSLFSPDKRSGTTLDLPRPIFLSVGRLAPEKNLDAFLSLDLPGTKVVAGDGPDRDRLSRTYPNAVFLGARPHAELASIYAAADVFVFPSLTDTFGLVLVEAMASGLPVAAFPVSGPIDVVGESGAGVLGDDLRAAAMGALQIDRGICRKHAMRFRWEAATDQFVSGLVPMRMASRVPRAPHEGLDASLPNAIIRR